jgi:hypothetical protein
MQSATGGRWRTSRAQTAALTPGVHGSALNVHGRSVPSSSTSRRDRLALRRLALRNGLALHLARLALGGRAARRLGQHERLDADASRGAREIEADRHGPGG